jgi:hypothetical protein
VFARISVPIPINGWKNINFGDTGEAARKILSGKDVGLKCSDVINRRSLKGRFVEILNCYSTDRLNDDDDELIHSAKVALLDDRVQRIGIRFLLNKGPQDVNIKNFQAALEKRFCKLQGSLLSAFRESVDSGVKNSVGLDCRLTGGEMFVTIESVDVGAFIAVVFSSATYLDLLNSNDFSNSF